MRRIALLLSFCVGFLSLSQEIAWVRIISFGQQGRPHAFSLVLVAFLVGISLGAFVGRRICARGGRVLDAGRWTLVSAAAFDLLTLWLLGTAVTITPGSPRMVIVLMGLIAANAGLKGILFPIVHHLGTDNAPGRVGRSVSRVYLGNVLGSTLGPIVTGFWLLDHLTVETVFALIATGTATLSLVALAGAASRSGLDWIAPGAVLATGIAMAVSPPPVIPGAVIGGGQIAYMKQNRYGVIHVIHEPAAGFGDLTYGGNAYDGRISVDIGVNSNGIDRAYFMTALHSGPARALVLGLSSGAWTAVILGMPGVRSVDVVEINPGYLDLIGKYPDVAPLLTDQRVRLHIDDARRWLRAHPEEKFDLIFQNTTWHWRAYTTLLLSQEYFRELSAHLNDGGILAVNTTESLDVYHTALTVFPHVLRYQNFAYMSRQPLAKRPDAAALLLATTVWGKPAFTPALFAAGEIGDRLARDPLLRAEDHLASAGTAVAPRIITDLNLVPEYRHGKPPPFRWLGRLLPASPNAE